MKEERMEERRNTNEQNNNSRIVMFRKSDTFKVWLFLKMMRLESYVIIDTGYIIAPNGIADAVEKYLGREKEV